MIRSHLNPGMSEPSLNGIFLYIFTSILVCSCLRVDRIEEVNSEPMLSINGQENMISDSVKMKEGSSNFFFELNATDPDQNLKSISYEIISGDGNLFQNGIITDEINLSKSEFISLEFAPSRPGTHILDFNIVDVFDREASITLDLFAFDNLPPVSRFELVKPEVQYDPLEFQIDASSSYDPDENFGGGISAYEYTFLGKTVELSRSVIGIIFPEAGTYDIRVRVKDNDGEWSDETIRSFKVN